MAIAVGFLAKSAAAEEPSSSIQGSWKAVEIAGKAVTGPTMSISGGAMTGYGGCNHYSGRANVSSASLKLGPVTATTLMCESKKMAPESALFIAIGAARAYVVEDATLVLIDAAGAILARFIR